MYGIGVIDLKVNQHFFLFLSLPLSHSLSLTLSLLLSILISCDGLVQFKNKSCTSTQKKEFRRGWLPGFTAAPG